MSSMEGLLASRRAGHILTESREPRQTAWQNASFTQWMQKFEQKHRS